MYTHKHTHITSVALHSYVQGAPTKEGKVSYRMISDEPTSLPIMDVRFWVGENRNEQFGVRVGRLCFEYES